MQVQLVGDVASAGAADWLVIPVLESTPPSGAWTLLNEAGQRSVAALFESSDATGKLGELTKLLGQQGQPASRVLLVGLGRVEQLDLQRLTRAVATAVRELTTQTHRRVLFALPSLDHSDLTAANVTRQMTIAIQQGSASQQLYRGTPDRHPLTAVTVVAADADLASAVEAGNIIGSAANLTRELVNRHPGELYPETFADRAVQVANEVGLGVEVFDESRLRQERMGSLLGVAQGSVRPPRMVVLEYRGGDASQPTLALVGKGVTFDSGGLSLKPSDGMKTMKGDMAGAATVLGAMSAIAQLKLPVNVIGLMGLVENMPSGSSYKLGEVLTARNGVTIEVMNTDAEGRLVLADVLSYAVDRGVSRIVDLATLTGSCVIALGEEVAGLFTNDQPWADAVLTASADTGEQVWQLPMHEAFAEQLKSDVADCKNIGTRWGGSITAAKFLEKFVGNVPWVHLDIAGPAFAESPKPHLDGGGTGAMLRTLVELAGRG
ncbi:MAG: leucyl aminopeptidase [Planctomycetaceae bacterium]